MMIFRGIWNRFNKKDKAKDENDTSSDFTEEDDVFEESEPDISSVKNEVSDEMPASSLDEATPIVDEQNTASETRDPPADNDAASPMENQNEDLGVHKKSEKSFISMLLPLVAVAGFGAGYGVSYSNQKPCPECSQVCEERSVQTSATEDAYIGRYRAMVSNHPADLVVFRSEQGQLSAVIRFTQWGNRVSEVLTNVYVADGKLHFTRSCVKEQCQKIGADSPIHQIYNGTLVENGTKIEGSYVGGRNATLWSAKRM